MISVIVPVYNSEKYLAKCLESIINQDYKDFELLIIDDGSSDNSSKVAKDILNKQDFKWQIISCQNSGQAAARNLGIKNAKGEYLAFVDSDDCISKDFLSELFKAIKDNDGDFSFCNYSFIKEQYICSNDDDRKRIYDREGLLYSFLKRDINFLVPSMLLKTSFVVEKQLYFNEEIRFSEDQAYIWKVILNSDKSVYLYKKMYGYYVRENSIMTSSSRQRIIDSNKVYEKYINELFLNYPQYQNIAELILPRWQLGNLYTAANILDKDEFKDVYQALDGKTIFKRISGIKEIKAYLLGFVCSMSATLLYNLSRKLNLNE